MSTLMGIFIAFMNAVVMLHECWMSACVCEKEAISSANPCDFRLCVSVEALCGSDSEEVTFFASNCHPTVNSRRRSKSGSIVMLNKVGAIGLP